MASYCQFYKNIQTEKQRVGVNQFNLKNGQTEQDNIILIINYDNSINSSNSNNIIKIITTLFLSPGWPENQKTYTTYK